MVLEETGDTEGMKKARVKLTARQQALRTYCDDNGLKYKPDRTAVVNYKKSIAGFVPTDKRKKIAEIQRKGLDISGWSGIIEAGSDAMALENQRYGRNKNTLINKTYIDSGEYRRKYDNATKNPDVNKTLYDCAKTALKHRSGTAFEDMYWIDSTTGRIVACEIDGTLERTVKYSASTKKAVNAYEKKQLISLHTHPSSMPPSAADFNACFWHGYRQGYIACHDGKIFAYTADEEVNERLYNMYIESYIKAGQSEYDAQWSALNEMKRNCKIDFWEVN